MATSHAKLCQYRYDALDLLVGLEPASRSPLQRFYRHQHLVTEMQGQASEAVFRQGDHLLALQSNSGDRLKSRLLCTDQQRSLLQLSDPFSSRVSTPYGHDRADSLLGYTGERRDPVTGHYLLGNGHRAFNPVLMRFNGPDRLSPFGRGGLNPYAYCLGDPVNFTDPSGEFVDALVRFLPSIFSVSSARIVMEPAVPFGLAKNAMQWGAAGHLPAKYTVGAMGSTFAGVTTMLAALTGVGSAVAAIKQDTGAAAALGFVALGLGAMTLAGRVGSGWAARDPKTIPELKRFVAERKSRVARSSLALDLSSGSRRPTAPPLTPNTLEPTAPPLTPDAMSEPGASRALGFLNEQIDRQLWVSKNAKNIRRHSR
ncbi:RHS repeat-associated core domain-containing protein [Pseudomonas sp. 14P_8.1_Bac3]|uniref:RHS repeat-associated core domain-containing protein n=1 Tax=Pseudomonas sp. 14P_8.1_Bac3 TaxID=2971621 RepID=UPI0021C5A2C0|nr:RHS repeat-associated core domain-containing protein [Pseudomonas sp. 14P_8.1_Bac3]MCU1761984.1 RHS repeat-associated core domain-containing protein [Pseudomonas sp. 14P_8.1_Bac3]